LIQFPITNENFVEKSSFESGWMVGFLPHYLLIKRDISSYFWADQSKKNQIIFFQYLFFPSLKNQIITKAQYRKVSLAKTDIR
jgi:hypothetical protein